MKKAETEKICFETFKVWNFIVPSTFATEYINGILNPYLHY